MVQTEKFSQFTDGSTMKQGDQVVGLRDADNARFDFPGNGLLNNNDKWLLQWISIGATAVNYPTLTQSATNTPVIFGAAGTDTDIGMTFTAKGDGQYTFSGNTALNIPIGTTATEPASATSGIRYDSDTDRVRFYDLGAAAWKDIASGGGTSNETYYTVTDETGSLPNSVPIDAFASGFLVNTNATGISASRTLTAGTGINITNPTGVGGDPVISATGTMGSITVTDGLIWSECTANGLTAIPQTADGILISSNAMDTTNLYTCPLMFGSTDANFTTTNPKRLAAISGEATEAYAADADGGMALAFFGLADNPGATPSALTKLGRLSTDSFYLGAGGASHNDFRLLNVSANVARIQKTANSGTVTMDFEPILTDGSSQGAIRMFRNTNTSGINRFYIYAGDGTSTLNHQFAGQGTDSFVCADNGDFGVGKAAPVAKLDVFGGNINIESNSNPELRIYSEDLARTSYSSFRDATTNVAILSKSAASGAATVYLDSYPLDGTSAAQLFMFRNTNTTGDKSLFFYTGDGTSTLQHAFESGANSFVCSDNGNFGVGLTNPSVGLHYSNTSPLFRITDSDSTGNAATPLIQLYDSAGQIGYVGFTSGSNSDISLGNTTAAGDLKLITNSTNRMIIDGASGDAYFTEMLGVGVSPSATLHVSASAALIRLQDSDSSGVTANPRIDFYDSSSRIGYIGFGSTSNNDLFYLAETGGGMSFRTNGNNERMTIESTGEVTIGTELDVDNININGNTISSSNSNGNLILTPNGTGDLVLDGVNWPQADGSADQVLKTDGAGQTSWATISTLTGDIVQIVEATDTTGATTTALMNLDNTIPQNTEGTEFITQAITPTDTNNTLLIEFWSPLIGNLSTSYFGLAALFQDSTADALVGAVCNTGYSSSAISIKYKMTAGTTSATTFKIRFGTTNASGAAAMNILGGGGLFSTAGRAYLRITEVAV